MLGIPTALSTLVSRCLQQMGMPRAIHLVGFAPSDCIGGQFQPTLQRKVLLDALKRWGGLAEPDLIWDSEYPE